MRSDISSSSTSFWQSSIWQSILHDSAQARDVTVFGYGIEAIMIEFRPVGMGMIWAFSLGIDSSLYTEWFLQKCWKYISRQGGIFWQIEEYDISHGIPQSVKYKTYGKHFLEPWTRILDLSKTEEELMASMHEKWRYNIRLAWKRGILTEWVQPTPENIDIWMWLLAETTDRDGFSQNSKEYYIAFLRIIRDSNTWGLIFARLWDRVIAAWIFVFYHSNAIYYYGASTSDPDLRKNMAPYLLQWEAIREAKLRGCKTYDFLGVAPPDAIGHSLSWVSNFKEKFGWTSISIGSKYLYIASPIRYALFVIVRAIKRAFVQYRSKLQQKKMEAPKDTSINQDTSID
mgnify:CR=1 FL=1|jgi:hypothetical protein